MKTIVILLLPVFIFLNISIKAQVAINTDGSAPDNSAMLDVKSTAKGVLITRLTQTQIEAITSPANGLVVFCTNDGKFYAFRQNDNEWKEIAFGTGTISPPCGTPVYDSRDGKSYNTVLIGTQCWMAENLNIGTMINGSSNQTDNSTIEKYCYDNNTSNCDTYGGLYQWDEMMQYTTQQGTQGICPSGWHIPTDDEWITLTNFLGGVLIAGGKMKETGTTHWSSPNTGATNESGFTALPGGYRSYASGSFYTLGLYGFFWSSSEHSDSYAMSRRLRHNSADVYRFYYNTGNGYSVRCLKN